MYRLKIQKIGVLITAVMISGYAAWVCVASLRGGGGISPLFFAVDAMLLMLASLLLYACRMAEKYGRWGWYNAINPLVSSALGDLHDVVVTDSAQQRDRLYRHERMQKVSVPVLRARMDLAEKLPFLLATDQGWRHLHTVASLVWHPILACQVKGLWKELFRAQPPVLSVHTSLARLLDEGEKGRRRRAGHLSRVWHMLPEGTRPLRIDMVLLGNGRTGVGDALWATLEPGETILLTRQMSWEEVMAHLTLTLHGYVDRAVSKAEPGSFLDLVEAASNVSQWGQALADYSEALFSRMPLAELSWRYTSLLDGKDTR